MIKTELVRVFNEGLNLLAAGEVACTGLHGANRLASNSLLEALVVAYRAGNHPSNADKTDFPDIPEWQDLGTYNENEWVIISHNRETLGAIMQGYVGIRRTRRLLKYALSHVENIYNEINNFYNHNSVSKEVIETRNLAIIALMITPSTVATELFPHPVMKVASTVAAATVRSAVFGALRMIIDFSSR